MQQQGVVKERAKDVSGGVNLTVVCDVVTHATSLPLYDHVCQLRMLSGA